MAKGDGGGGDGDSHYIQVDALNHMVRDPPIFFITVDFKPTFSILFLTPSFSETNILRRFPIFLYSPDCHHE